MNTKTVLLSLAGVTLATALNAQVIAAWNFNDFDPIGDQLLASTGSGTLTVNGLNIDSESRGGTLLNAVAGDVAGVSLSVLNDATGYLQFEFDLSAAAGVSFSFAAVRDDSPAQNTVTGVDVSGTSDFAASDSLSGALDLIQSKEWGDGGGTDATEANSVFSFNIPASYEGDDSVFIRLGIGNPSGFTTRELLLDNVVIEGAPIPEPSTYALIGGALALGLAFLRRRCKS